MTSIIKGGSQSGVNHLSINLSNLIQSRLSFYIFFFFVEAGNEQYERRKGGRQNSSQMWFSTERNLNMVFIEGRVMHMPQFPSGAAWTTFFILHSSNSTFSSEGTFERRAVIGFRKGEKM